MKRTKFPLQRTRFPKKHNKLPGRRSIYSDQMLHQVYCFALLGATDQQIADFFQVDVSTIDKWKMDKPDFLKAMNRGKLEADGKVVKSFYQRAIGYNHPDTHIIANRVKVYNEEGRVVEEHMEPLMVPIIKHYPPDVVAGIFWLKNRQRAEWSDALEHHHTHSGTIGFRKIEDIPLEELTEKQREVLFQLNLKQLSDGTNSN